jgi:hypothetical protein
MKVPYTKVVIESAGVKSSKKVSTIDTGEYQVKRSQILAEINANKIVIDRDCFIKSHMERVALKQAKRSYMLSKTTAIHNTLRSETISYIANHPTVCGNLILTVIK